MSKYKVLFLISILSLLFPVLSGCTRAPGLDDQVREAAGAYRFHLWNWELKTLSGEILNIINKRRADNTASQETLIEQRVRAAYSSQGIYNPLDRFITLKIGFPPINIYLAEPPRLLVVSPRDHIENIRSLTLLPETDEKTMSAIEARIDALGYSALVVELGGIATYPSYVSDDADTEYILKTAAEEWLHQYLAFTPLGFLYVLDTAGIRQDYDISTINESVAGIISEEIGETVYQEYYAPPATNNTTPAANASGFDFNKEMREIRLAVDSYLVKGEIEAAENYMETKRLFLVANGYNIRKLNQAYFAFYGTYADSPTSVSPIGGELKQLRSQSTSLKAFLDKVVSMTGINDLAKSLQ
jgi:hypothetical protein